MSFIASIEPYTSIYDFDSYCERMELLFILNNVIEAKQVPLFITFISLKTYGILKNLLYPEEPSKKTYSVLKELFKNYFKPCTSIITERCRLKRCFQNREESISNFIIKLQKISVNYSFGDLLNNALRDNFIGGLCDKHIQLQLMSESPDLTFRKAYEIALTIESISKGIQSLNLKMASKYKIQNKNRGIDLLNKNLGIKQEYEKEYNFSSFFHHKRNYNLKTCQTLELGCFKCHRRNHIQKICHSNKKNDDLDKAEKNLVMSLVLIYVKICKIIIYVKFRYVYAIAL